MEMITKRENGLNATHFLHRPREQVIMNPPANGPIPELFPQPSLQSNSGSMSLFATQSRA